MILEFLLVPLLVPFVASLLRPRSATAISTIGFLVPIPAIIYGLYTGAVYEETITSFVKPVSTMYLWGDAISYAFGLAICVVSAMVALYSLPYMRHRFEELGYEDSEFRTYFILYGLYAAAMLWLVFCGNFVLLYLFLEISLITSFLLIYRYGYGNRRWVGTLYFIWTHIAGLLALIGFFVMGFDNGSMALNEITKVGLVAWLLIFIGMIVKLPGLGPHIWLPWAHAEAPTPVSALLSPLTVGLGAYIILRTYQIDPWFIKAYTIPIFTYGVISSLYAGLAVLWQKDYKRLLAYSTVSQMGYMLIGICAGTFGVMGVVIQYISHAFGKSILFMTAGGIIAAFHGLRDIRKMGGMHEYVPTIGSVAVLGWMNISGIIAIGMFGEFFILKGVYDVFGFNLATILPVVAVFILSGLYSFYTLKKIFYGMPAGYERQKVHRLIDAPLFVIAALSILLIFPPLAPTLLKAIGICLGGLI